MRPIRFNRSIHAVLIGLLAVGAGLGQDGKKPAKPVPPVSASTEGVALSGYDPVAYFEQKQPVEGKAEFTHRHEGAMYRFQSAEHRDLFTKDPAKYAPQYGGYCAWAVGHNYTAPTDPNAWAVVDGKLYLNYNKEVQQKWQAERDRLIREADKNWPGLHQ